MLLNTGALALVFKGFTKLCTDAHMQAPSHAMDIAMSVPSSGRDETCSRLGNMPGMRERVGPRQVQNLKTCTFSIVNTTFEATVELRRADIADDRLGVFAPFFQEMGQSAKRHPDLLVFDLLKNGFSQAGHDGQFFFDTDHPVEIDGMTTTVANTDGGSGAPWFLLDTFIATSMPPCAHLLKPSRLAAIPARGTTTPGSDAAAAVCAQLGPRPGALDT